MAGKRVVHRLMGWVLAEIICCVIIVSTLAVCVTESTGMTVRVSRWEHVRRTGAVDLWSLVNETSHGFSLENMTRGVWRADISHDTHMAGMKFATVSVTDGTGETPEPINWKSWEIEGRHR